MTQGSLGLFGPKTARTMIEDPLHSLWTDQLLNDHLRICLSRSYDLCEHIIADMVESPAGPTVQPRLVRRRAAGTS